METIKKQVGERVRQLRLQTGFNNAESLAEALDVSATSIYNLERGESWVSADMLLGLCSVFRCEPRVIFEGVGEPTKSPKLELFEFVASLKDTESELVLTAAKLALSGERVRAERKAKAAQEADKDSDPGDSSSQKS